MGSPVNPVNARHQLVHWYATSRTGQALHSVESAYLKDVLRLCYGQHFLQIGSLGWEQDFWEPDCFRRAWIVDEPNGDLPLKTSAAGLSVLRVSSRRVIALAGELPIASNSIDLLLLPHTLEFEADHHQLLREAARVLKPGGQLHFLGFNPYSVFGVWRYCSQRQRSIAPGCGRFVASWRILDWLSLLNFEAEVTATFSASLLGQPASPLSGAAASQKPSSSPSARSASSSCQPFSFQYRSLICRYCRMPWFATGYAIRAVKRTYQLIPIGRSTPLGARLAQHGVVGPTTRDNLDG